ncbi:hypothetical protein [Janibacter sp. GXQ6167]|uniref:hypothetical protein n=1 Tax=Janibacter sp. GXQ6167 TaxID=3240791 RepID=UPI0035262F0F
MSPNEAQQPLDAEDQRILDALRGDILLADPVPPDLAERCRIAVTLQALDAELAHLADAPDLAIRSTEYERVTTLTFTAEDVTAMIEIDELEPGIARIRGWSTGTDIVELRERSRRQEVAVDSHGRFTFDRVERGLVHLIFRSEEGGQRPVISPVIEI